MGTPCQHQLDITMDQEQLLFIYRVNQCYGNILISIRIIEWYGVNIGKQIWDCNWKKHSVTLYEQFIVMSGGIWWN